MVPIGTDGEVVVRGPQLMSGYAGRADATRTRTVLRRGWLNTGDVGHLDAEGYLYLTHRLTDVIVWPGRAQWSSTQWSSVLRCRTSMDKVHKVSVRRDPFRVGQQRQVAGV